jgi:hypothetical protein
MLIGYEERTEMTPQAEEDPIDDTAVYDDTPLRNAVSTLIQ